jgi:hypothetical protein
MDTAAISDWVNQDFPFRARLLIVAMMIVAAVAAALLFRFAFLIPQR